MLKNLDYANAPLPYSHAIAHEYRFKDQIGDDNRDKVLEMIQ